MSLRADAERNRRALLEAAGTLFDQAADPSAVTMDDVVHAAGVGKGTLFRRYASRTELLRAILADRLDTLTKAIASGAPPLGPAAAPRDRLWAILVAIVSFKIANLNVNLALENARTRAAMSSFLDSEAYRDAHALVAGLLRKLKVADPAFQAHLLLGLTRTDLLRHLVSEEHFDVARISACIRRHIAKLLAQTIT